MEAKDAIYGFGILVTLGLGVWNFVQGHRATRRASFVNTVTAQRVLWLEKMRQDISKFVGLTHTWARADENDVEQKKLLVEVDQLRYLIRLRLNPDDEPDQRIAKLVKMIPDLTDDSKRNELYKALDQLTDATQEMLKGEWEKVKSESKEGDLSERTDENWWVRVKNVTRSLTRGWSRRR